MKKVSILQLKRNTNKLLKQAPLVVTSGGKPAYILLDYDSVNHEVDETVRLAGDAGFTQLEYNGKRVVEDIPPLVDTEGKPNKTFWQQVKNILKKKVF